MHLFYPGQANSKLVSSTLLNFESGLSPKLKCKCPCAGPIKENKLRAEFSLSANRGSTPNSILSILSILHIFSIQLQPATLPTLHPASE